MESTGSSSKFSWTVEEDAIRFTADSSQALRFPLTVKSRPDIASELAPPLQVLEDLWTDGLVEEVGPNVAARCGTI